jgi:hypothetical protein
MSPDPLARVRDRDISDMISELDIAIDILETIPPSDGIELWEWDTIRAALATAADYLAELREDLR